MSRYDFIFNGFHTLFKFAAHFSASDYFRHLQHLDPFIHQRVWDLRFYNSLSQSLHDDGFPHTRFANEYRVILFSAGKDLNDAADFFFSSDNRVKVSTSGQVGQVGGVLTKNIQLALGIFLVDVSSATHDFKLFANFGILESEFCENIRNVPRTLIK